MRDKYQSQIDSFDRQLRKKGRPISIIDPRVQQPTDGSDTPIDAGPTTYAGIPALILTTYGRGKSGLSDEEVPGSDAITRTRRVLLPGKSCPIELQPWMYLAFDSKTWKISGLKGLNIGGAVIFYEMLAAIM